MFLKTICIFFVLNTFTSSTDGITLSTRNETNLMLAIKSQQSKLREEQDLQRKMMNELVKKSDIQELQDRFIDRLVKAMDIQSLRADTQLLRADTQSLRAEQERQGKLIIDGLVKTLDIPSLKADIQLLRVEQERQGKLIVDGLVKELNISSLKAEQERQGKLILNGLVEELNQRHLRMYSTNCADAKFSGIHDILLPSYSSTAFKVACDATTRDGGWTTILRRMDGSVNFNRNWTEYKNGFGNMSGEFFIGLDKLHALTAERDQELLVLLEDFEGDERFETYEEFGIGGEDEEYKLHTLGKANGTAGDSLNYHRGMKFSTFDRDNDRNSRNCAKDFTGAWWHKDCHYSQLTGTYNDTTGHKGVIWFHFRDYFYSLKKAVMMIRPRK